MKQEDPARELFFRELFTKQGVRKILESACGTGLDLLMFRSLGCQGLGSERARTSCAAHAGRRDSHKCMEENRYATK